MKKRKIILDCDTKNEIDDQFAIAYALNHPGIELLGVVSVQNDRASGTGSVGLYHEEAETIVDLSGADTPCFLGSGKPLTSGAPEQSEGVDFILENAQKYGDKLTIVATGPATDLASTILLDPDAMAETHIIWIGAFRTPEDLREKAGRECNFDGDPAAFAVLMRHPANVVLLPAWGVTDAMMIQCRIFAEKLREKGSRLSEYLAELIELTQDRHRIFWDIAAVAAALDFGLELTYRSRPFIVKGSQMGFSSDWDAPDAHEPALKFVDRINALSIMADAAHKILNGPFS